MTEETLNIDVELDDELFERLSKEASKKGITISELATEIINIAIENGDLSFKNT